MKKYALFILVFAFAFSLASATLAAPPSGIVPDVFVEGWTGDDIGSVGEITDETTLLAKVARLIEWVAWIVGLLAVLMGLYAGILFITGGGDTAKIEKARGILLYAIVGIVVAIIAFGLVAISKSIVGIA